MAQSVSTPRVTSGALAPYARGRLAALILLVALSAFLGFKLWRVRSILGDISVRAAALSQAAAIDPTKSTGLVDQLRLLADDIHNLRGEIGPFVYLAPLAAWVPQYGGDAAQASSLLEYGETLMDGASGTARLFNSIGAEMDAGHVGGQPLGQSALSVLKRHQDDIQNARAQLERVLTARSSIEPSTLSPRSRELFDVADHLLPMWSAGVNAFQLAPDILGGQGTRVYLLVIQNSDELRPTGGFISSIVRVRVENGDISTLEFSDSYAVDNLQVTHPDPPAPLKRYMDAGMWVIRDANWSPDYPTAARDIEQLYQLDRGLASDGVIAVDLGLVPRLLEAVGPVQVEGYPGSLDAENAVAKLKEYWASPQGQGQTGDWWLHRKDLTGQLIVALLDRLRSGEFDRVRFARAMFDAFSSKDLMLYVNDPAAQGRLEDAGWAGRLSLGPGDHLMVVDSNVGFNKVDPSVDRAADYSIELDQTGTAHEKLTLTYTNRSPDNGTLCVHAPRYFPTYEEMQQACYWDYMRLVAGEGAQLLSATEGLDAGSDDPIGGRSVFHGFIVLPRSASRVIEYNYETPRVVENGKTFRLRIENQPGAPPRQFHLSIKLPDDWTEWTATPAPAARIGQVIRYDLTLDRDLNVVVQKKESSPLNLAIGLGLGGFSLISGGLWWLRRNRRRETRGREVTA